MTIVGMDDLAAVSLSQGAETLTWETSGDWDNAVSEEGVVHESVTNTDHGDATVIKMGYSAASPYLSADLGNYHPFDEDSGSTAYDFSGNSNDGSITGATVGQTGLLGTTANAFDGIDDYVNAPLSITPGATTVLAWLNITDLNSKNPRVISDRNAAGGGIDFYINDSGNVLRFSHNNGTDSATGSTDLSTLSGWIMVGARWDGSELTVWLNGSQDGSLSTSNSMTSLGSNVAYGVGDTGWSNPGWYSGNMEEVRIYSRALTASEIQTLYDVTTATSTLTSATKSFSSSATPDLQNLDYTLNGQSIDIDVIGSPGTASEETVTQTLDGGTTYTLTWASSHTDFRLRPTFSTTDPTTTPTFSRGELVEE